ncbi:MAG TPA: glycosyltransferase family 4 protein [Planctomycetota bacterium]|nr:glycosyltransferase family 4 protein [Planctomycetota bacterium]
MKLFLLSADSGIAPDGTKGASVHLREWAHALTEAGVSVVAFSARAAQTATTVPFHDLAGGAALSSACKDQGVPDLVYERYSLGSEIGLHLAQEMRVPFVLEVNAPLVDEALKYRQSTVKSEDKATEKRLLREANLVVVVSEALRDWVVQEGRTGPTLVVRNGCNEALYGEARRHSERPPTMAFLGHPKPWHGAERVLPLIQALDAEGTRLRFLIIGGGPIAQEITLRAATLGLADAVEVTGPLRSHEVAAALQTAQFSIAPYERIPFFYFSPLKIMESMMAGVPVLTTDQGDLKSLVGAGGVVVPPESDEALGRAMGQLARDPLLCSRLGALARERAMLEFTWRRAVETFLQAVAGMIRSHVP